MKTIDDFEGEYRFLSNFYKSPIEFDGITYPTVEHAYQAQKTLDNDLRLAVSELPTAGDAKRFGNTLKESGQLREDWEEVKVLIMTELCGIKFQISYFKKQLLLTGDAILIEGNTWHDNFWGDCVCKKCLNIEGKNNLGIILMAIREKIK